MRLLGLMTMKTGIGSQHSIERIVQIIYHMKSLFRVEFSDLVTRHIYHSHDSWIQPRISLIMSLACYNLDRNIR